MHSDSRMVMQAAYPELAAGGYSRRDGTMEFFQRVNALLQPHYVICDLGAGRGAAAEDRVSARRDVAVLRGKVARVIGADLDPVVRTNPTVDEAVVLPADGPYPFADGMFDLIVSDHTLEHVQRPDFFAAEVDRVLKPGGWFCARTPYRWGLTGIATTSVPNRLHVGLLSVLQPSRKVQDVFPTHYKLNTSREIQTAFPGWSHHSYRYRPEPAYLATTPARLRVGRVLDALLPSGVLMVFIQKPPQGSDSAARQAD